MPIFGRSLLKSILNISFFLFLIEINLFLPMLSFGESLEKEQIPKINEIKDDIEFFWIWFAKNQEEIYKVNKTDSEAILDNILTKIHKIQPGLSIEISVPDSNGIRDLVVSAEGDKSLFPTVEIIVSRAPKFEKWRIIAFRQRANINFKLTYQNITLEPAHMFFEPQCTEDALDLIVYAENIKNSDPNIVNHYCLIMMDNLIGEFDCVMTVRYYDFKDIVEMPKEIILKRLIELPRFIDDYKMKRKQKKN